jgi:hypothetical protein
MVLLSLEWISLRSFLMELRERLAGGERNRKGKAVAVLDRAAQFPTAAGEGAGRGEETSRRRCFSGLRWRNGGRRKEWWGLAAG